MRNPQIALHRSESFGKIGRQQLSEAARFATASGKRRRRNDALVLRREADAYARHALAANGFGDALAPTEPLQRLSSVELCQYARKHRALQLAGIAAATLRAVGAAARRLYARWQRAAQARTTYVSLQGLDTRTLRDLGVDRSEIHSVAAEIAGMADSTRVLRGRPDTVLAA